MGNVNGGRNIPVLGQKKPRMGTQFAALVRDLDENGTLEPEQFVMGPNGQQIAIAGRRAFVTAVELVEMVREAVRQEVRTAIKEWRQKGD